jgi:hypothetical protein
MTTGIGETESAIKIAPVCHLEQYGTGNLLVYLAKTTIKGAAFLNVPIEESSVGRRFWPLPLGHQRPATP